MVERVEVIKPFLNLKVGDQLVLNYNTGKYEFFSKAEDISESFYSFDDYEIAIDQQVVAGNLGEYFSYAEIPEGPSLMEPEYIEMPLDERVVDLIRRIERLESVVFQPTPNCKCEEPKTK